MQDASTPLAPPPAPAPPKGRSFLFFLVTVVLLVAAFLGGYIRERQREGALRDMDPAIMVRSLIGMVMHHSLNNNLWDPKRRLLDISNEAAAKQFTDILLHGIAAQS